MGRFFLCSLYRSQIIIKKISSDLNSSELLRVCGFLATFPKKSMDVYITTLDKESEDDVKIILDMFSKDLGDIKFLPLRLKKNTDYFRKYKKLDRLHIDDITEILKLIKEQTETYGQYIVLLTEKGLDIPPALNPYEKDWNSVFISRNVVVNSSRWIELTEDRTYLALAHQIIENVFQALSYITLSHPSFLEDIHLGVSGCINDFCADFNQIHAKILSGFICQKCQERFLSFEQEKDLVQLKKILRRISNRITDNFEFEINSNKKIVINEYGDIKLGGSKLNFRGAKIVKHTYLFYLINYNKIIRTEDLEGSEEVRQKFVELSTLIGLNYNLHEMDNYITHISTHQSRTKKYLLNSLINENLLKNFEIKGKKEKVDGVINNKKHYYQISVEKESDIEIDPSLLKYRLN